MYSGHPQDLLPRHLQDVFKTFSRRFPRMFSRHLQDVFKTSSRHIQEVLKMYHQVKFFFQHVFKTFASYIQHVFEKNCEDDYLEKNLSRPYVWDIYGHDSISPKVNSLDISKLLKQFFPKLFMRWMLPQIKIFLLKSGIRENVACLVNKESMNKGSSENVFPWF